jgi:hypothetical protein
MLLEQSNYVAVQPVIRSLYETWIVIGYAESRFRQLVLVEGKWARFDELAARLLTQRSSRGPDEDQAKVIGIGMMLDHVAQSMDGMEDQSLGERPPDYPGAGAFLRSTYDQMSDGAHPTMWPLMPYGQIRPDELGIAWTREPDDSGLVPLLSDLKMSLGFVVRGIQALIVIADKIRDKFGEAGFATEPEHIDAAILTLESAMNAEPELPQEALLVLRERGGILLEALKQQRAARGVESGPGGTSHGDEPA